MTTTVVLAIKSVLNTGDVMVSARTDREGFGALVVTITELTPTWPQSPLITIRLTNTTPISSDQCLLI